MMKRRVSVILLLIVGLLLAGTFPARAGVLSVPVLYQQQDQWCWAGSCQMILSYYGYASSQCDMANWCFYQSSCCYDGSSVSCNQANWIFGYPRDMEDVLVNWGPIYGTGLSLAMPWSTLISELDAGRPFVIGFSWLPLGTGGHAMVGTGYTGNYVHYNDPWPGNGATTSLYNWMVYDAGDHVWDESYRLTTSPSSSSYRVLAGGDYIGDGHCDIAIFRPTTGLWSIRGVTRRYFGVNGDIPVPGNYQGDSRTEIAIFRPSTGLWSILGVTRRYFGTNGDTPVPADYNGDGVTEVAIFRPTTGLWSINGVGRYYFGGASDQPVPGPYAPGGVAEIAIFRPSTGLWALASGGRGYFGNSGDIPVPGDYGGLGDWGIAIFRPSTGLWAAYSRTRSYFGGSTDQPVPGNYQGGSGDEMAVFRASSGRWAIRNGNRYYYGQTGDIPVTR